MTVRSVASFQLPYAEEKYPDTETREKVTGKVATALNFLRLAASSTSNKSVLPFVRKNGEVYRKEVTIVAIGDETMESFAPYLYGYPEDADLLTRVRHYYSLSAEERKGLPKPICIGYLLTNSGDPNGHFAIHVQEPIAVLSEI